MAALVVVTRVRWGQAADSIEAATSSMVSRLDPAMLPKRVLTGRVQVADGGGIGWCWSVCSRRTTRKRKGESSTTPSVVTLEERVKKLETQMQLLAETYGVTGSAWVRPNQPISDLEYNRNAHPRINN